MPCNTADNVDHGEGQLQDCFEAVITKYEDGYILCPILWSGGSCEKCMEDFKSEWISSTRGVGYNFHKFYGGE